MSEMVESMVDHVAKQIFANGPRGNRPAAIWQLLDDDWKEAFRATARVAIKAMREPTRAMIDKLRAYQEIEDGWAAAIDEALEGFCEQD